MTTLHNLLFAAGKFAMGAYDSLDPMLAARLAPCSDLVIVTTDPPAARLIATAPGGTMTVVHTASPPPQDLAVAVAAALESGLAAMTDATRSRVASLLATGAGRLVVMIDRDEHSAAIGFDPGDIDRLITLAVIGDTAPAVMH